MPEILGVGILAAFLAGVVSFLSPCVLPLVPGYVSYVAGRSLEDLTGSTATRTRFVALGLSIFFVMGFSTVFIALGASATALGKLFLSYRSEADIIAGSIVVLFGLHLTGLLRLSLLNQERRIFHPQKGGSILGAYFLGAAFAFGWTPCIGPILGAILTLSTTMTTVGGGVMLLSIYSLGLAVPFILVAAFTGFFIGRFKKLGRVGHALQIFSGGILILVGMAMATGYLTMAGTWMLETFPFFQEIVL